jgi:hypothetical protein
MWRDRAGKAAAVWVPTGGSHVAAWLFPPTTSASEVETVLGSAAPNHDATRQWSLFGLDCRLPAVFTLTRVQALPANVRWEFASEDGRKVNVQRWGLPDEVLQGGSLTELAVRLLRAGRHHPLPAGTTDETADTVAVPFHPAGSSPLLRWLGRSRRGRMELRFNADRRRILMLEQHGPANSGWINFQDVFHRQAS